jgi:hypothetical protein
MEEQITAALMQYVNWILVVVVACVVEPIKAWLPDDIEPKVLPIMAIAIGALIGLVLALVTHVSTIPHCLAVGVASGFVGTGGYAVVMKVLDKIVENIGTIIGNILKGTAAPVKPQ